MDDAPTLLPGSLKYQHNPIFLQKVLAEKYSGTKVPNYGLAPRPLLIYMVMCERRDERWERDSLAILILRPSRQTGNNAWAKEFSPNLILLAADREVTRAPSNLSKYSIPLYARDARKVYTAISEEQINSSAK